MSRQERRAERDRVRLEAVRRGDLSKGLPSSIPWWVRWLLGVPNTIRAISFAIALLVMSGVFGPGPIIFGLLCMAMAPTKGRDALTGLHLGTWLGPFYMFWMMAANRKGMMR